MLFFIALLNLTFTLASDRSTEEAACTPIESYLDSSSIGGLPVGDQGSTGLCYAYSAVALIDSVRLKAWIEDEKNPDEFQYTSVMDAAILSVINDRTDETLTGGNTCTTVNAILAQGACVDDEFYSVERAPYRYSGLNHELMVKIARYRTAIESQSTRRIRRTYGSLNRWLQNHLVEPTSCLDDSISSNGLLGNELNELIIQSISQLNGCTRFVSSELEPSLNALTCRYSDLNTLSQGERMRTLDQRLQDSPNQTIGISYCSQLLTKRDFAGVNSRGTPALDCSKHASVIDGRRWNPSKNKCEYRIRNSWGACTLVESIRGCKGGTTWVDAEDLSNNIYGVSGF